jgi:hypothetical protein
MLDKVSRYVLHPFFMAAYPILFLLSVNAGQIPIQQAGRILPACLFVALILTLCFGSITKNLQRGGFLTSILLALFFSYGHTRNWLENNIRFLATPAFLYIIWATILITGIRAAYFIKDIGKVTVYLNVIVLLLLLQPLAAVGIYIYRYGIGLQEIYTVEEEKNAPEENAPDIYYLILDGHGRSDVLQELYDYNDSGFMNYLRQQGFYVAEQSRSNYAQTALSISSSLNLNYLKIEESDLQSTDRSLVSGLIKRSKLRTFLRKRGYQTVAFSTGYDVTTLDHFDIFFPAENVGGFNNFENLVFSTSAISALDPKIQEQWFTDPFRCDNHRSYVLNIFENLEKVPEIPGPKFVFAHIISPHPPFVFGSTENEQSITCFMSDGDNYLGEMKDYEKGYRDQVAYIDAMTQQVVQTILEKSTTPPVIIIQADHGSGMMLDWSSSENACLRERFSILNAYYIPGDGDNQLYETITPVNSFRVVLNEVFGTQMPLLEDKSYYSTWKNPYLLEDVTDRIEPSCKLKNPNLGR